MPGFQPQPQHANFDLVSAVVCIVKSLPITIQAEHVKGHQDESMAAELTFMERLNIHMESLAKRHRHCCYSDNAPLPPTCQVYEEGCVRWHEFSCLLLPLRLN